MDVNYNWVIGVALAALGSFVSNLGVTLQKLHHIQCAQATNHITKDGHTTTHNGATTVAITTAAAAANGGVMVKNEYYKQSLWRIGLILVVVGSVADFVALSFAPQSLVAPLGSLTLVSNVIFAPLLLKERITRRDLLATITIVSGSTIAVAFASHNDVIYDMDELFSFYFRLPFLAYISAVLLYIGALNSFVRHMTLLEADLAKNPSLRHHDSRYIGYDRLRYLLRFAYPSMSGTIGAQSVLFAKCTAELLANTTQGNGFIFARWQSYAVILGMACTILFQIKWLNEGLMRFAASYTVPVFMAFWIVLSVMSGLVFFSEYRGMDDMQLSMFAFGVMMTVAGVVTLSAQVVEEKRDNDIVSFTGASDRDEVTRDIDPVLVANIGKALSAGNVSSSSSSCSTGSVMNISVALDNATGRLSAKVSTTPSSASSPSSLQCTPLPLAVPVMASSSNNAPISISLPSSSSSSSCASSAVEIMSSSSQSLSSSRPSSPLSPSRWPSIPAPATA